VTKLVHEDDEEKRQVLADIPKQRRIRLGTPVDLEHRHQEPGPVQKHVDRSKTKEADRSLAGVHARRYITESLEETAPGSRQKRKARHAGELLLTGDFYQDTIGS